MARKDNILVEIEALLKAKADTKEGKKELEQFLKFARGETIPIKLDTRGAQTSIRNLQTKLLQTFKDTIPEVKLDLSTVNKQIDGIKKQLSNLSVNVNLNTKGLDKDIEKASKRRKGSSQSDDSRLKTLRSRRADAYVKADQAYQKYGENHIQYKNARRKYMDANAEYVKFAAGTGVIDQKQLADEYGKMLSQLSKNNPFAKVLEKQYTEALKAFENNKARLDQLDPLKQTKASQEEFKIRKKIDDANRKESEKARADVFKEALEQDKHATALLTAQTKAQAKSIAEEFKKQAFDVKEMKSGQIAKSLAMDLNNAYKSGDQSAIKEYTDRFKQAMQDYVASKNNLSANAEANLYKNMARHLKDASPVFDELIAKARQLKQVEKEIQDKIGVSSRGGGGFGGSGGTKQNTSSALKAEIGKYAAQAEEIWTKMQTVPKGTPAYNALDSQLQNVKSSFREATENLIRFQRELGGMSPGQAAKTLTTLASSLGRDHSLYKQLIEDAKKLRKEQESINKEASGDKSTGRWFGNAATYLTHFLGRSSKGWGSFGEAVADLAAKIQGAGGAIGRFGTVLAIGSAIAASVFASGALVIKGFDLISSATTTLGNILMQIGTTIYNVLKPGIELYKQQTSAMFSLTASLKSNAKYFKDKESTGEALTTPQARGLSRDIITRATLDAELSAFSLEELLRSLQGTLPILLSKGFSLDQAYEINKGVAGVAKQIQLTPSQILQEARDLAQGSITSRGSQVANALGITNQDIAKYKGNVDKLFNYLMGKFKEYSELLSQFEDTALGRWQQLQERWQSVTRTMVDGVADQFQVLFENLINSTGNWIDKDKNKLNAITGRWEDEDGNSFNNKTKQWEDQWGNIVPKSQEYADNVGKAAKFELSKPLQDALKVLKELVDFTINLADKFAEYVKEATNGQEPMETLRDVIEIIEIVFVGILEKIVDFCLFLVQADGDGESLFVTLYNGSARFFDMLGDIYDRSRLITLEIKKWAGLIEAALVTLGVGILTGGIGTAAGGALKIGSKAIKPLGSAIGKATQSGIGKNIKDGLSSGIDSLRKRWGGLSSTEKKVGVGATILGGGSAILDAMFGDSDDEKIQKEIDDLEKKIAERKPTEKISSLDDYRNKVADTDAARKRKQREDELKKKRENLEKDPSKEQSKVKGTPSSELSDKERNKQIQEAQKAMKANIQELKDSLKDFISDLKDTLEKNKIAYDEGFMSMKDYFNEKARIEKEEAQAKLEEAQAELAEIQKTPFKNEDDQRKEVSKLNREIKQYTRELNKAIKAQQEVARNMEKFTEAQNAMSNFMTNNLGKNNQIASSGGYNYSDVSQLGEGTESLAKLAVDIVKRAKQVRNVDIDVGKLLGLFFAEVGQAGNSRNWLENKNPGGFTANSATPKNMVDWGGGRGPGESGNYETYVNVPYMTMLDHIINTWLKWYQKELQVGTSTAYMNSGLQGVYHSANVNRTSTYDAGVAYAKSHGLYDDVVKPIQSASNNLNEAANNLNNASNNLVDNSGKVIGYTPESQYSRGGIDTRYSNFQNMSSGVDAQIAGLDKRVAQVFNLFAKKYFERTGEKVLWTSFTGDMRPGYHNPHAAGEGGHRGGKKGDLWINNQQVAKEIAKEIGLAFSFEGDHYDMSAHGGVYGPGLLTPNQRADELWARLQQATQGASSSMTILANEGLPALDASSQELVELMKLIKEKSPELGALMLDEANTTQEGHEAYKQGQEYLNDVFSLLSSNISRVTGNLRAQLLSEFPKLLDNVKKYRTNPMMLEQVFIDFNNRIRDKMVVFAKDMADYNLKVIEADSENRGADIIAGSRTFADVVDKYYSYFTDKSNPYGIAKFIDMLEIQYRELEARGFTKEAFEIREYIFGLKNRLVNMIKSWIDKVGDFYDKQQSIFDATEGFTPLQREFGAREFKAYKAQAQYEAYSKALEKINKDLYDHNKSLKEAQELIKGCAEDSKDYAKYQSIINYESRYTGRLESLKQEYEYQKRLADLQRKQPEYLRDLRNTAKDALEDGLVTFLTDGINEAESLGEALRNLAITFLKEIQKISAKWMVKSLMNKWFGQFQMDTPPQISIDNSMILNQLQQQTILQKQMVSLLSGRPIEEGTFSIGDTTVTATEVDPYRNYFNYQQPSIYSGSTFQQWTNPFSRGTYGTNYQLAPLANSQFGANNQSISFGGSNLTMGALDQFGEKLQSTSDISLTSFSNTLDQSSEVAKNMFEGISDTTYTAGTQEAQQAMQNLSISVKTASAEIQTTSSTMTTGLQTAFMQLEIQAKAAAQALSRIAFNFGRFAEGGLIKGPGTSTSDSIPAMLSNGEFVVRADVVKKMGVNYLNALNNGNFTRLRTKAHHYASGGLVSELAQEQTARGLSNFGKDVGTNISNTANISVALVRDEQEGMKQLLRSPEGQRIMLDFSRRYASVTSRF